MRLKIVGSGGMFQIPNPFCKCPLCEEARLKRGRYERLGPSLYIEDIKMLIDEAVFVSLSPHELYERKISMQELHAAISRLPDKQAKRIYAHFILGMTKKDIAQAEGVDEKVVRVAIERGLKNLEKYLKKFL